MIDGADVIDRLDDEDRGLTGIFGTGRIFTLCSLAVQIRRARQTMTA